MPTQVSLELTAEQERLMSLYRLQLGSFSLKDMNHNFYVYNNLSNKYAGFIRRNKSKQVDAKLFVVMCKEDSVEVNNLLEALEYINSKELGS